MSTTDTRAAFEAWAISNGHRLPMDIRKDAEGSYAVFTTSMLYEAWQAATEAAKATGTAGEQELWQALDFGDVPLPGHWVTSWPVAQQRGYIDGYRAAVKVEAARQSAPVVACTCPSGDGSLRWPCPQHPQLPVAITDKTGPNGIKWYVEPNLPDGVNLYIKEQK